MADIRSKKNSKEIVPGMKVEATEGDLGTQDISSARVTHIERNEQGEVEAVEVSKGVLFRKKLEIPVDRVREVDAASDGQYSGDMKIDANESELESLTKPGEQRLSPKNEKSQDSLLDQVEQQAPTAEGLREKEGNIHSPRQSNTFWRIIGPGVLSAHPVMILLPLPHMPSMVRP